jgi:selenocysteine lyase/cysteine desulfurase
MFSEALDKVDGKVDLAIVSHIDSVPGIVYPVSEIAELLKSRNVKFVAVDGAHAVGQIEINLRSLSSKGVDFYTSNCHKWLYCPSGCAFLWVNPSSHLTDMIQPAVLSMYDKGSDLWSRFVYTGTRDYTPFCVVPETISFIDALGGTQKVQTYLHSLAKYAGNKCAATWGTSTLVSLEADELFAAMVDVRFPTRDWEKAKKVREILDKEFDMYMIVYERVGEVWTRLSAAIYLQESDFDNLARTVLEVLERIDKDAMK